MAAAAELLDDGELTGIDKAEGFLREAAELLDLGSLDQAQERLERSALSVQVGELSDAMRRQLEAMWSRLEGERARRITVVVGRGGTGDVSTLAEGLEVVPSGGSIRIRSGVYDVPSIVVDKPVSIEGDGPGVILRCETSGVLELNHLEGGRLANLTVEAPTQGNIVAIGIRKGHWELIEVEVHGSCGVKVEDGAGPRVERCRFCENQRGD